MVSSVFSHDDGVCDVGQYVSVYSLSTNPWTSLPGHEEEDDDRYKDTQQHSANNPARYGANRRAVTSFCEREKNTGWIIIL